MVRVGPPGGRSFFMRPEKLPKKIPTYRKSSTTATAYLV